jgi:hypothetical protein
MTAARRSFSKARWVKPAVLVDAEFRGKTGEGLLRHPSCKGIREDLNETSSLESSLRGRKRKAPHIAGAHL